MPKNEGGLGIRPLKEVNIVLCLKLIWRLSSNRASLWVRWVHCYLIRKGSFWSVNISSVAGSWMWKKLLKVRDLAMLYHRMEVNNGRNTYFWYDDWSSLGHLTIFLRGREGCIDLGIMKNETVAEVISHHRRRRHRVQRLNDIEDEIEVVRRRINAQEDQPLWKHDNGKYSKRFSTKLTWLNMRQSYPICNWSRGVWFPYSTPKYSFLVWVAIRNRLQTCDRIKQWDSSVNGLCVLCQVEQESCQHLFFACRYSAKVWKKLVEGLMYANYTEIWREIIEFISQPREKSTEMFLIRYTFQALVHSLWRERNDRRHGEQLKDENIMVKMVDKQIRLKLLLVKGKGKKYLEEGLCKWFETRV